MQGPGPAPPPAPDAGASAAPGPSWSLRALAIVSVAAVLAVFTIYKMSNNDIWIHLKTGEYVLQNGWVPDKDPYSFIASDRDYVAHEWLAGVAFYLVYAAGGVTGLIFFKAAILAASNVLLIMTARLLRARWSVILPALGLLLYISSARYLERPHIFSYLMAALYLYLFFRWRELARNPVWLWLIVPAHVVWANLHGGWVQGLLMVVTFALGETLRWWRASAFGWSKEGAPAVGEIKRLWLVVASCAAATLINPYGVRIWTFPFELTRMQLFMQQIYEWQPPFHLSYNRSTMFALYLVHVLLLFASFVVASRPAPGRRGAMEGAATTAVLVGLSLTAFSLISLWFADDPQRWSPDNLRLILYFLFGFFCISTLFLARSADPTLAGVFALMYLLSLRHNRAVTDATMATFPVLAASASAALDRLRGPAREAKGAARAQDPPAASEPAWADRSTRAGMVLGSSLLLVLSAHAYVFTYYFDFKGSGREKGFGIADNMPICSTDFVEANGITGNAFVSYSFAAMLIQRMYPSVKVNMDSRNDVYGEDLYREYVGALRDPTSMTTYLQRHPIDFFMLSFADRNPRIFDALETSGEWAIVFFDDRGFVMVRRKPETDALIRRNEYRWIRPQIMGGTRVGPDNAAQIVEEAARAIENCPTSVFGYVYKAKALLFLGRFEESIAASETILARDPTNLHAMSDMAAAYTALGNIDTAITLYERASALAPDYEPIRENLRKLRGF